MANKAKTKANSGSAYLRIGEVAGRTSVTERTLRFYEEKGLLRSPERMEGGFRLYSDADVQRVERIKDLQKLLGFSLAEIKEMVDAEEVKMQLAAGYNPDADLHEKRANVLRAIEVTERQHSLIQQKVNALDDMKVYLEGRLATFRCWLNDVESRLNEKKPRRRRSKNGDSAS
jgi:DNA-binding transcriptional MerR regulator